MNMLRLILASCLILLPLVSEEMGGTAPDKWRLQSSPTSNSDCVKLAGYLTQIGEVSNEHFLTILGEALPNEDNVQEMSVPIFLEAIPLMQPEELALFSVALDEYVAGLESIDPPDVAEDLHVGLIRIIRLVSNYSREVNLSGLRSGNEAYSGLIDEARMQLRESVAGLLIECPNLFSLTQLIDPLPDILPQVIPGDVTLKNVYDALAAEGLSVSYGRQVVRVAGVLPVGQQLRVDDISVYVFIFSNPIEREQQVDSLTPGAIVLESPAGASVGGDMLKTSEGSNVLVISSNATEEMQSLIDAAVTALP